MSKKTYTYHNTLQLESGRTLPSLEIAYHTYGELNKKKNNVIWICHALTASSDAADWWSGLVGENKAFDTKKYFIVCANVLGSCYGSSGPLSVNPVTEKKYYGEFPQVTIRDMVNAHILLRKQLGIEKIFIGAGGSMGAYQLLEWAFMEPNVFEKQVLMNTSARESAWGIAIHTAQRLAIEADATWKNNSDDAGTKGLKAARAIGMLTYRNYETFARQQTDDEHHKLDNYKSSSYIHHQGDKLIKRFNAYSYWLLSKSMDSHNIARGRTTTPTLKGGTAALRPLELGQVLKKLKTKTLIIGISSDILCPNAEQKFLAKHLPKASLKIIDSTYGHDGFLIEWGKLTKIIASFLKK
ncbi:MAG: homoserine O-acetyltransferase [Bacteroidetes bacterium]|nr:MAG: homoserine O-acetyltransferase [Bacteroidota bacterium]